MLMLPLLHCVVLLLHPSLQSKETELGTLIRNKLAEFPTKPDIDFYELYTATPALLSIIKQTSASYSKQSAIKRVIIGKVPDRGGRTEEHRVPVEMPAWAARQESGGSGHGYGGRGGRGGRGGYQAQQNNYTNNNNSNSNNHNNSNPASSPTNSNDSGNTGSGGWRGGGQGFRGGHRGRGRGRGQ